jgi:hypothetical protein
VLLTNQSQKTHTQLDEEKNRQSVISLQAEVAKSLQIEAQLNKALQEKAALERLVWCLRWLAKKDANERIITIRPHS